MARLKLGLYGTPRDELASTVDGDVPDWTESLYESYGTTSQRAPRQWDLVVSTDLDEPDAQAQLENAGVWVIARLHAPLDKDGNVRWSHGLAP